MATAATLEYLVKVQDQDLKDLRKELKATQSTMADDKPAKSMSGGFSKMGLAAGIAGGLIGGVLVEGLKSCFEAALTQQKIMAQSNAVIKATGGVANVTSKDVDDLADSIQRHSGISKDSIETSENMLLRFKDIRNEVGAGNDVFNRATQAVANLTAAGKSQTASSKLLGKALEDPEKGLTRLTSLGVTFTQSQKDQIKALEDSGNTLAAQKIILDQVNTSYGGAADAAGKTLPGQLAIAKGSLKDLEEHIGTALLPILTSAVTWINTNWPTISAVFQQVGADIKAVFDNVVVPAFNFVLPIVESFVNYIRQNWPQISATVSQVMNDVKAVITGILGGIESFWDTWGSTIKTVVSGTFNQVKIDIQTVVTVIRGVIEVIDGLIHGDWGEVWNGLKTIVNGVFTGIINTIANLAGTALGVAAGFGTAIYKGITNALKGLGDDLISLILTPINDIIGSINDIELPTGVKTKKILGVPVPDGVDFGHLWNIPTIPVPKLASGGIVNQPTLALIGEAGPEAVVPLSRGGMGQTVIHINNPVILGNNVDGVIDSIHYGLKAKKKRVGAMGLA